MPLKTLCAFAFQIHSVRHLLAYLYFKRKGAKDGKSNILGAWIGVTSLSPVR
jgi:hypothetical protein